MHETLDPIDRLFLERSMRERRPVSVGSSRRGRRTALRRLRAGVGRQLIRIGAAIAAEPMDVIHGRGRASTA